MPSDQPNPRSVASLVQLATILPWLACGPPQAGECTANSAQAILGGSSDASSVGLDNIAVTVAAIVAESDVGPPSLCSGVLIAPRFVLTAGHCASGTTPLEVRVSFGPTAAPFARGNQCAPPTPTYLAVALERDPDADVMLVELASNVSQAPVPIALSSPAVGQKGVIAGYGLNEQGTAGVKLFVGTTVVGVGTGMASDSGAAGEADSYVCAGDATVGACSGGPLLITVDSGADAGACAGDSGGPLFVRDASGWEVAGVLREGSAYCTGEDVYVDLPSLASWIRAQVSS